MITANNVKISVVFFSKTIVKNFLQMLKTNNFENVYQRKNIVIVKGVYTITVFLKKCKYHVNVTKIQNPGEIPIVIQFLTKYYFPSNVFKLISYKIDNMTATLNLCKDIHLEEIASKNKSLFRFNPERFPAVYYKSNKLSGTVIIFSTGRINILGCTSEEELAEIWREISHLV